MEKIKSVFIKGNIPSSKNSKVATSRGVFHSKAVSKFLREQGIQHYSSGRKEVTLYKTIPLKFPVKELKELFKDVQYPCELGLHFVRDKKTKFDFINISQIIMDILVAFDIIPDDNMDYIIPYAHVIDNRYYTVDKLNPGVYIVVKDNTLNKTI